MATSAPPDDPEVVITQGSAPLAASRAVTTDAQNTGALSSKAPPAHNTRKRRMYFVASYLAPHDASTF